MLSVRLCLSSALRVLHRSFHGKCTGTDYRWLERESEGLGGVAGSGFVVRRWAAEWADSKSLIMHTPTPYYPLIYLLYLFTLAFSKFFSVHTFISSPVLYKISCLSPNKHSDFSTPQRWIIWTINKLACNVSHLSPSVSRWRDRVLRALIWGSGATWPAQEEAIL